MSNEDNQTQMYVVIYENKQTKRLSPCPHKHATSEEAFQCVGELEGLAIIEWQLNRRPQFGKFWVNPGLEEDEKLAKLTQALTEN